MQKKQVTIPELIKYVMSFSVVNKDNNDTMFQTQIKSNDSFKFYCLKSKECRNMNDFPEKIRSIFDPYLKDFIRYGANQLIEDDTNITFYYSILFHLVPNYDKLSNADQMSYIHTLRDKLVIHISDNSLMQTMEYNKCNWEKAHLTNPLAQLKINKFVIKLIADYFNLNIFMLNTVEDKIYVISDNFSYDIFRQNIFMVFNDDIFEPLVYNGQHILDYMSSPINKLMTVDKNKIAMMNVNLRSTEHIPFVIKLSNFDKYNNLICFEKSLIEKSKSSKIMEKNIIEKNIIEQNIIEKDTKEIIFTEDPENGYAEIILEESDINICVDDFEKSEIKKIKETKEIKKEIKNDDTVKLTFNISQKMKLSELQIIAQKLGVTIEKNGIKKKVAKTKIELINDINDVLQKK